jgi:hypothetical protein
MRRVNGKPIPCLGHQLWQGRYSTRGPLTRSSRREMWGKQEGEDGGKVRVDELKARRTEIDEQ